MCLKDDCKNTDRRNALQTSIWNRSSDSCGNWDVKPQTDMVLWKVSQATKDPTQEKLGPNWEGLYKVVCYSRRGSYYLEDMNKNLCLVLGMQNTSRSTISE